MKDYYIILTFACFMVTTNKKDIVTWAAPIAKWTIGKNIKECIKYWESKNELWKCMLLPPL